MEDSDAIEGLEVGMEGPDSNKVTSAELLCLLTNTSQSSSADRCVYALVVSS